MISRYGNHDNYTIPMPKKDSHSYRFFFRSGRKKAKSVCLKFRMLVVFSSLYLQFLCIFFVFFSYVYILIVVCCFLCVLTSSLDLLKVLCVWHNRSHYILLSFTVVEIAWQPFKLLSFSLFFFRYLVSRLSLAIVVIFYTFTSKTE